MDRWHRATLATGPGWAGKAPVVRVKKLDERRALVWHDGWLVVLPRALLHALVERHEPETDPKVLKQLEKVG